MAKSPLDVRLYRSSVKGRRPAVGDMAYGDLAINYNHEEPALIIKGDDNALIEFKPGAGSGVKVAATAPANPKDGDLWWDTTSARLFLRYTSGTPAVSTWVDASPAAVPPALANALTYKGTIDPTVAASAPASPGVGDTYVASKAGTVDAGWTGFGGSSVALHELMVWDGTEWDGAGAAASPRTPWQGKVDVTAAKTAGYSAVAGDLLQVGTAGAVHADWPGVSAAAKVGDVYLFDGAAWQYINAQSTRMPWQGSFDITAAKPAAYTPVAGDLMQASAVGTPHADWAGVSATAVVGDAYLFDGTAWKKIGPDAAGATPATTSTAGAVRLADAAAITAGTAGRVVDAAQLKAERVWSRTGTTVTPVTAGDLVDAAALPVATATALGGVKVGDNLQIDATGKLSANLASVLTYRGAADPTAAPPATPKAGDTYVASAAGTGAAGWTGLAGSSVSLHELLVWDGTEWDGAGVAAAPRTAWRGAMDVTAAKPAGYTAVAGDQLEASAAGAGHADWPGVGATVVVGDIYLFDGTTWKCLTPAVAAPAAMNVDMTGAVNGYVYTCTGPAITEWSKLVTPVSKGDLFTEGGVIYEVLEPNHKSSLYLPDNRDGDGVNEYLRKHGGPTAITAAWLAGHIPEILQVYGGTIVKTPKWLPAPVPPTPPTPPVPWKGTINVTAAKPAGFTGAAGDQLEIGTAGTIHADWPGVSAAAQVGDIYIYDGTKWQALSTTPIHLLPVLP